MGVGSAEPGLDLRDRKDWLDQLQLPLVVVHAFAIRDTAQMSMADPKHQFPPQ